ncbi:hypothetical protein OZ411_37280 [Bradyrhizobium sp. Arg237L]|uniref:hypothetical protein n=1 Tax=Bradyrhizobium sp. Arg237L TaxID=3003352 RepID=UPI00249DA3C0|nr:hypothetical protein [Bradyrhizobium sp. Arg237L]MDI4238461.1 hypothetical protein [Bradyrhizobium sp. Arg237L]
MTQVYFRCSSVIDRRQDHAERRREHIAELNKRAAEAELRLKRLYDAIEAGVADLRDLALKDRIAAPGGIGEAPTSIVTSGSKHRSLHRPCCRSQRATRCLIGKVEAFVRARQGSAPTGTSAGSQLWFG